MALGFFRKRQKMIIIIMVLLMVSFLIGMQGFQMLFSRKSRGDVTVGASRYGEITLGDLDRADSDLRILGNYVELGARSIEYIDLQWRNGDRSSLAYALLLQQADEADATVTEDQIDAYLRDVGISEADYNSRVSRLRANRNAPTEKALRGAIARWLRVLRGYRAAQVATPPSEPQLRRLFRDLNEKIELQVLEIPAGRFSKDSAEPTAKEIDEQFKKYRNANPGQYSSADSFGFGYRQPDRAAVSYLLVDREAIERVARPDPRAVRQYWREHKGELTKRVPLSRPASAPASQPGTRPSTGPASRPEVETIEVPITTLDEAWDQIVAKLSRTAADEKMETFMQQVQAWVRAAEERGASDVYKTVVAEATRSADGALGVMVPKADIAALRGKTLEEAVAALAKAVGLRAICYPWGTTGQFSVSPDVRVPEALKADTGRTLRAVLAEITRLVFAGPQDKDEAVPDELPTLTWATCREFDKVLFCTGEGKDMRLFPLTAGRTGLSDRGELVRNEALRLARTSPQRGRALLAAAFDAEPFRRKSRGRPGLKLNQPGPVMYVGWQGSMGRLLWRLVDARAAHVLVEPTDEVRKRIITDLKELRAFSGKAADLAEKIRKQAEKVGLEAAAKAEKMETLETGPIARKVRVKPAAYILQQVRLGLTDWNRAQRLMILARPVAFEPSRAPGIRLPSASANERLMSRAFELVPEDIENAPPEGVQGPVAVVPVPPSRSVFVIQRVGYTPALIGDFENIHRAGLTNDLQAVSEWAGRVEYFTCDRIIARTDYKQGG